MTRNSMMIKPLRLNRRVDQVLPKSPVKTLISSITL